MVAQQSLMARRHFLFTSALVGTAGLICPALTHAAPLPPSSSDAQSLGFALAKTAPEAGVPGASIIGTTAAAEANGDSSIRPFHYRATNDELADLKRRVA